MRHELEHVPPGEKSMLVALMNFGAPEVLHRPWPRFEVLVELVAKYSIDLGDGSSVYVPEPVEHLAVPERIEKSDPDVDAYIREFIRVHEETIARASERARAVWVQG
jgi:hypothetical protein